MILLGKRDFIKLHLVANQALGMTRAEIPLKAQYHLNLIDCLLRSEPSSLDRGEAPRMTSQIPKVSIHPPRPLLPCSPAPRSLHIRLQVTSPTLSFFTFEATEPLWSVESFEAVQLSTGNIEWHEREISRAQSSRDTRPRQQF